VLFFAEGNIVHASLQPGEYGEELDGEEIIYRILNWEDGSFIVDTDVGTVSQTIHTPWSTLLMRALERQEQDREQDQEQYQEQDIINTEQIEIRRENMAARTTTDILNDLLDVPGISSAVVVGRDGFVIEAAGANGSLDLDALGASLAHAINGVEMMGRELQINLFEDLFVEYGNALILARPVGDAVIALVAPDASQLGIVRYQIKSLIPQLASFF
jgi:predicted regulator of Ras-like GTPase activity (Roadblock/LC7/MglB family)